MANVHPDERAPLTYEQRILVLLACSPEGTIAGLMDWDLRQTCDMVDDMVNDLSHKEAAGWLKDILAHGMTPPTPDDVWVEAAEVFWDNRDDFDTDRECIDFMFAPPQEVDGD